MDDISIRLASPHEDAAHEVLSAHADMCQAASPPGSCHFLDKGALAKPGVTFWLAVHGKQTIGCVAVQNIGNAQIELKSMHVRQANRGGGMAERLLAHAEQYAREIGGQRMVLETGSDQCLGDAFSAARKFYARNGYSPCPPFGDYEYDPFSVFMSKLLR